MFLVRVGPTRWLSVQEIISRWYGDDFIYVKVRTEDDRLCVLRYDAPTDRWTVSLAPVRAGDADPAPKSPGATIATAPAPAW